LNKEKKEKNKKINRKDLNAYLCSFDDFISKSGIFAPRKQKKKEKNIVFIVKSYLQRMMTKKAMKAKIAAIEWFLKSIKH
jgi:hypothetical protein